MPRSVVVPSEEEMRVVLQDLKANNDLSVTRVRELLKVGYTKARKLLDEANAGETYVPPVETPADTDDLSVMKYIEKLISEEREVKPDILRRDLNIGYKRAKRLIDSMGGNRSGLTVIPPIARKPRRPRKKLLANQPVAAIKRAADGEPEGPQRKRRKTSEKRVSVVDILNEQEEDCDDSEDCREMSKPRQHKNMEHLLKIGIDGDVSCSSSDADSQDSGAAPIKHRRCQKPEDHDDHAHTMLMLDGSKSPDGLCEETSREHRHHHHHSHGHHSHHSHHHNHHKSDSDHHHTHGHSHGHGHSHSHVHGHGHHSHHHQRDGHHCHHGHHHSHHGHGHHHSHHSHHSESHRHHRSSSHRMSITALSSQDGQASPVRAEAQAGATQQQVDPSQVPACTLAVLPGPGAWMTDIAGLADPPTLIGMNSMCLPGCGIMEISMCTDLCSQPVSALEQFSLA